MTPSEFARTIAPLLAGLVVGAVGAMLLGESMPGAEGSAKERADKLEAELKQTKNRLTALENADGADGHSRSRVGHDLKDGLRSLGERIRAGHPVSPDEIFRATQPFRHDIAPLFERLRVKEERQRIDSKTGELARKYNLSPEKQAALKTWFQQQSEEEAKRSSDLMEREDTRLEDWFRAMQDARPDKGLDKFMETILSGDQLASFKAEDLSERAGRVQSLADARVQRLDNIVQLSDAQRDQVFAIMARSSPDYDPAMALDGARGEIGPTPAGDPREAMLSVLTPDQRVAYDSELRRRREEASKDLEAVGLTLPPDWEMLDDLNFK